MTYLILTIFSFIAWWRLLTTWKNSSTSTRIISAFVLTTWQITATMTFLGILGHLNYWSTFSVLILSTLILWYAGWCVRGCLSPEFQYARDSLWKAWDSHLASIVFLISLSFIGMSIWYAFKFAPMAYDYYHLVKAAMMVQEGNLGPWGWDDRGVDHFPANVEIIFAYILLGTRSNTTMCLVQFVFGLVLSLAVYRTCRNFGVRVAFSAVAGMLLWSSIVVFHESWMALNDLAVTAMIGIGWMYLTKREIDLPTVLLSSLAFSWALGSKVSTVYWLLGASIYLIWRLVSERNNRRLETDVHG